VGQPGLVPAGLPHTLHTGGAGQLTDAGAPWGREARGKHDRAQLQQSATIALGGGGQGVGVR
jgi:hypothetical protein